MKLRMKVDPTRCRGYGICVLFFPEGLELDGWGYGRAMEPELDSQTLLRRAHRVVRGCPNGAISLVEEEAGTPPA